MSEQKQCGILNEIEMHVEAIQRLVKGHDQGQPLQEVQGQIKNDNKRDNCGHCSILSTISRNIDNIHQAITDEKTRVQLSSPSTDQQSAGNPMKEALEYDTSVEKALNNSVVLRAVMKHLNTKDLFNLRLVAKKWEDEATSLLLSSRFSHQVKFIYEEEERKFRNGVGTLDEFTDRCLGNPLKKFPCSQFVFENVTTPSEIGEAPADLSKFFSNHGHRVQRLSLKTLRSSTATLNIVRKIVFEWTPNLQTLTILGHFDNDEEPKTNQEIDDKTKSSLSLEHLKLSCDFVDRDRLNSGTPQAWAFLIRDILLSAPNIKTISDDHLWFTTEIVLTGKIPAVHHLIWAVHTRNMMSRRIEFSQSRPQLTFLEVDLIFFPAQRPPSNVLPTLLQILQSSQNTLKSLKFHGRFFLLDGASQVELPDMGNLQEFSVTGWNSFDGGQGKLLPEKSSLQKSFPGLKTLRIKNVGDKTINGDVDNPFGYSCNASTTVQELTIGTTARYRYQFDPSWLSQATDLYPNVRVFHLDLIGSMEEVPQMCRAIWFFWSASFLEELSINLRAYGNEDCANIVDQALTGFDQETCKLLQKQQGCCRHCHGAKNFERGPSILDMTSLKFFQLNSADDFPVYSQISVIHAFEPMRRQQNLKVKVGGVELKERILEGNVNLSDCLEYMDKNK